MLRPLDAFRYRGPTLAEGNDAVPQGGLCGAIAPSGEKADYGPFPPKNTDYALCNEMAITWQSQGNDLAMT